MEGMMVQKPPLPEELFVFDRTGREKINFFKGMTPDILITLQHRQYSQEYKNNCTGWIIKQKKER